MLLSVLPQLECKLKSSLENERLGAVALLARMFSEKGSQLAIQHTQLWRAFLGRFNDISVAIRIKCVQYSMHFLLNHPELRKDITDTLKLRQHDADESVRYEVVMAIVTTARRDFEVVSDSEDLLEFVKERTLDKKVRRLSPFIDRENQTNRISFPVQNSKRSHDRVGYDIQEAFERRRRTSGYKESRYLDQRQNLARLLHGWNGRQTTRRKAAEHVSGAVSIKPGGENEKVIPLVGNY